MQRLGIIKIFQQGYRGHAACHDRKIRILSRKRLEMHLNLAYLKSVEPPEHEYEQQPPPMAGCLTDKTQIPKQKNVYVPHGKIRSYLMCVSIGTCLKQLTIEGVPYPLCRALKKCPEQVGSNFKIETIKKIEHYLFIGNA
jgi:hypothetical protein